MIKPEVLDALAAAGATADMIVAAVKADAAADEARKTARRAKDAERQRRHRSSKPVTDGHDVSRVTACDSALPGSRQEVSPAPLQETQLPNPLSPPKGGSISRLPKPNGFSRFWEAYPRKVGKRAAELAYDRALRRIPGHDPPGEIMAGLDRARADPKWRAEPEFIPNPATWLNQDRWLDGLSAPPEPLTPEETRRQSEIREQMIEHALQRAATH